MNLLSTGKFIQEQRKNKKLTQIQLAQKIGVSEKTISKWECGNGFPDTSLMLPLCKALDITANELLSGKLLPNEKEYKEIAEENLILLKSQQEKTTKYLLAVEWVLIWLSMVILISSIIVAAYTPIALVWKILLITFGIINLIPALCFCMVIETKAGFYECAHCHHKYIPSYKQTIWSMHMGRTRYMKCPKCHKHSWNKKTISSE